MHHRLVFASSLAAFSFLCAAGCGPNQAARDSTADPKTAERANKPAADPVQSNDILERDADTNRAFVKHILIGWREIGGDMPGAQHPAAAARSKADADQLVTELVERIRSGESFEDIMVEYSEDTTSARTNQPFEVTPSASLVLGFRRMALRLKVDEIGVVRSEYGWHIIKRIR